MKLPAMHKCEICGDDYQGEKVKCFVFNDNGKLKITENKDIDNGVHVCSGCCEEIVTLLRGEEVVIADGYSTSLGKVCEYAGKELDGFKKRMEVADKILENARKIKVFQPLDPEVIK